VVENQYIEIRNENDLVGFYDANFGGNSIYIGIIDTVEYGYYRPIRYKINLGKIYTDVLMVRMISSAFPKTFRVFNDGSVTGKKNNRLHWQNIDDGSFLYFIEVTPGNYTAQTLKDEIELKVSQQFRYNGNVLTNRRNRITIDINTQTDQVVLKNYNEYISVQEPFDKLFNFREMNDPTNPAYSDPENQYYIFPTGAYYTDYPGNVVSESSWRIRVLHFQHESKTGEYVSIKGAINLEQIDPIYLNREHMIIRIIDEDHYDIVLSRVNLYNPSIPTAMGGFDCILFTPNVFRLRFDLNDTMGQQLGFRDVGKITSITPYDTVINNDTLYEQEDLQNVINTIFTVEPSTLQQNLVLRNAVQLDGPPYLLLICKELQSGVNLGRIKDYFYKINMEGLIDTVVYDTYVDNPIFFVDPLNKLSSLTIEVRQPDGSFYDFGISDHSFTLEIVTLDEIPQGTAIRKN
jgi:hypothetical protein